MSVRRAALAGLSPWIGLTVLLPFVNFVTMILLATLPDGPRERWDPARGAQPSPPPAVEVIRTVRAIGAAFACGAVTFLVVVNGFGDYAASFFLGAPLVMGAIAGFVYNRPDPRPLGKTILLGVLVMAIAGGFLLLFAFEGLICLAMAVPIVVPLALLGAALGKGVADATRTGLGQVVPLALALPLVAGAESLVAPLPEYCVLTTVEVDAPPEAVWRHVVAFADIPPPTEWFFRAGVACPLRARIEGSGVGAVRHCEFTTGDFVEPVTAWDEPRRLAFDVAAQPDPMVELSPWGHVHPPHLRDRSLQSRRGEFLLVDLGGGRTRLEGRTWYTFAMRPQAYWTLWSDFSIHAIHRRVLAHIKRLAEADAG